MILIVDDNPQNLISLKIVLEKNNFEVDTASSGEEALKKALKNEYVLIILDVQMPGMDGFEVAEALSGISKTKDTAIIFLSAVNTDTKFITKGYTSGALDYITKPVDINIILLKVKTFYRIYEQNRILNEMQQSLLDEIETRKKVENKKDEFISIASHELKTPLTSVKGYMQLLERSIEKGDPAVLKSHIQKAHSQLNKLNDLVTDLLDISKMESGKMMYVQNYFDAKNFFNNIIEVLQQNNAGHKLHTDINVSGEIYADEMRVEQVIINFVTNAIKYSPGKDHLNIRAFIQNDRLHVSVRDYGLGLTEAQAKHVFEKFYRVEETAVQIQGLGIGLYISSEIINRHNGEIGVKRHPDGAEFYFIIPTKLENQTN